MSIPTHVRGDRIRQALVTGHETQYVNDATFHHAVHVLATLLVPMMDGIAAASTLEAENLLQRMAQVMNESLAAQMRRPTYRGPAWRMP